jgi:hypothetical protein
MLELELERELELWQLLLNRHYKAGSFFNAVDHPLQDKSHLRDPAWALRRFVTRYSLAFAPGRSPVTY